jgi:hypothetical protein
MKMVEAPLPTDIEEYKELFKLGKQVFFPDFISVQIDYRGNDSQARSESFGYLLH